jgi:Kdo2-lipid IVA lauroyltransferase/acyltransferase
MKRMRDWLTYVVLRVAIAIAGAMPRRLTLVIGAALGDFAYHVLRVRRRVVEENLRLTLGQTLDRSGVDRIARGVYQHLGRTLLEYGQFRQLDRDEIRVLVEVIGFEHLRTAHAHGRGVIVAAGHFGNWELGGGVVSFQGYPMHFVAKEQRNPYIDRYMNRSRGHLQVGLIHPGPEIRRLYRCLRDGEIIGMLLDQDAGPDGEFIDVLGRVASVQTGAAIFSVRTGAPIIPSAIVRLPDGRHRGVFEPPLYPDPNAPFEAEVRRLTTLCTRSLERHILENPEQYYWVHRRWKTRPPGEKAPDERRQAAVR